MDVGCTHRYVCIYRSVVVHWIQVRLQTQSVGSYICIACYFCGIAKLLVRPCRSVSEVLTAVIVANRHVAISPGSRLGLVNFSEISLILKSQYDTQTVVTDGTRYIANIEKPQKTTKRQCPSSCNRYLAKVARNYCPSCRPLLHTCEYYYIINIRRSVTATRP